MLQTLTPSQWRRLGLAIARTLRDSTRTDELLVAEELVCRRRFNTILATWHHQIARDPEALALLCEKPRIAKADVDFDALRALPEATVGGAYVRFLDRYGLDPDLLADPIGHWSGARYDDPDAAFLHERYRQTHDLWHALVGLGTAGHEEVLLHAFTWGQLRLPYSALIVAFGTLKHILFERRWDVLRHGLRDAWQAGRDAAPLLLVRWEDRWGEPLDEVRRTFRIRTLASA
jgi:ubiquinone biosynthesis protein COQ4